MLAIISERETCRCVCLRIRAEITARGRVARLNDETARIGARVSVLFKSAVNSVERRLQRDRTSATSRRVSRRRTLS